MLYLLQMDTKLLSQHLQWSNLNAQMPLESYFEPLSETAWNGAFTQEVYEQLPKPAKDIMRIARLVKVSTHA